MKDNNTTETPKDTMEETPVEQTNTTNPETNEQTEQQDGEAQPDVRTLEDAEAEIAELKDKLLRQVADFTNYRRQQQKNIADLILNGGSKVIESLLPVLDDMERAEQNIATNEDINVAREGLQMIFQKLKGILGKHGLQKIDTADKAFDTDFHEAVAILPMGEEKKDKIIDTVQAGYMLNDKVLRHAKVVVGQ